jgi:predicted dehydrogenase
MGVARIARVIRVGLIGLGYWGPNYARIVSELPGCEMAVICDASQEAVEFVESRFPSVRTTGSAVDVFEAEDVDAVIVCTPTTTHHELARQALANGKHVLCEKPLAMTIAQCDDLTSAAALAGCVLFVGHTFLFNPAVRRMQDLINEGEVGRLLYAHTVRTGLGPIRHDVNALWDLAPHDLSILFYLFQDEPVSVSATGRAFLRKDVEDVVFAQLRFRQGAIASLHVSWLDPYKVRRVTAVGDRRMVVFDDMAADEKLKVFDKGASYEVISEAARGAEFGEYKAIIRDGDIFSPRIGTAEPLKEQVAEFIRCCESGEQPFVDGLAGRRVVAVLEAATESLRIGGAAVDVDVSDGNGAG